MAREPSYLVGLEEGYTAAVRDICAGLRAKGIALTSPSHAADVIERGDFVGFVSKATPQTTTEGDRKP